MAKRNEVNSRDRLLEAQTMTLQLSVDEALASARAAREQAELVQEEVELVRPLVAGPKPNLKFV